MTGCRSWWRRCASAWATSEPSSSSRRITCTSWGVVAFSWQVFLYSGGLHLGFAKSAALMSVVTSIGIVSLIPGGLGVTEAGAAQLLTRVGFAPATAQAGSILLRAGSLVAIALGAGHLALWKLVRSRRHGERPRGRPGESDGRTALPEDSPPCLTAAEPVAYAYA